MLYNYESQVRHKSSNNIKFLLSYLIGLFYTVFTGKSISFCEKNTKSFKAVCCPPTNHIFSISAADSI